MIPYVRPELARREGGPSVPSINATDLEAALTGDPEALDVHLALVERDILIDGHGVEPKQTN
jgi:hypothetical protein